MGSSMWAIHAALSVWWWWMIFDLADDVRDDFREWRAQAWSVES